jgi:hypothetical protein
MSTNSSKTKHNGIELLVLTSALRLYVSLPCFAPLSIPSPIVSRRMPRNARSL